MMGEYRMKVLHVCNIAGVASVIAKWMDKLYNTESHVIQRNALDKYGLTLYGELVNHNPWRFALSCLLRAREYDIVHIHGFEKMLRWMCTFYRLPVIIHYHGTRIRRRWSEKRRYWKYATRILYSTKDVEGDDFPDNALHIPNPVDTDLFHPFPECDKQPNSALSMAKDLDVRKAQVYAKHYGLNLAIQDLCVPHIKMPELLNRYEYYIDSKTTGDSTSKTGLEALACGLKVIDYHRELIEKFPEQHKPESVVAQLYELYNIVKR